MLIRLRTERRKTGLLATLAGATLACGSPAPTEPAPAPELDWRAGPSPGAPGTKATTGLFEETADAILPSQSFGVIPGRVSVSDSGSARYAVSLWASPGRGGMTPQLSLQYGGGDGNPLLGVGWSLGGFSRITRCRPNYARDGASERITFTDEDPFCLDGQRLVPIVGSNGADGTKYRTEVESLAAVTSHDREHDQPVSFTVQRPNGTLATYEFIVGGQRTISEDPYGEGTIAIQKPGRYAWLVTHVEDANGNTIEYEYDWSFDSSDMHGIEVWPTAIHYGGNTHTGAPANRRIEFLYGGRPDERDAFINGLHLKWAKRMSRIRMFAPVDGVEALVRDYMLLYKISPTTGRSLMYSLREFDGGGKAKKSSFTYAKGADGNFISTDSSAAGDHIVSISLMDADGDGLADLIVNRDGEDEVWTNDGASDWAFKTTTHVAGDTAFYPVDLDHDGKDELVRWEQGWDYSRWSVSAWADEVHGLIPIGQLGETDLEAALDPSDPTPGLDPFSFPAFLYAGDFDGDGAVDVTRRDLIPGQPLGLRQWTLTSNDYAQVWQGANPMLSVEPSGVLANGTSVMDEDGLYTYVLDLDGDGRDELLFPAIGDPDGAPDPYRVLELTDGAFEDNPAPVRGGPQTVFMDINGDGLRDQVDVSGEDGPRARLNLGAGFSNWYDALGASQGWTPPSTLTLSQQLYKQDQGVRVFDENNDGRADFGVLFGGGMFVYRSNGRTFDDAFMVPFGPASLVSASFLSQAADLDGDSVLDFVTCQGSGPGTTTAPICSKHLGDGELDDVLIRVRNGRGYDEKISYTTLIDADTYTHGDSMPDWPVRPVVGPARVVDTVSRETPLGTFREEIHTYEDARIDRSGPGMLGFGKHTIHIPDLGRRTERTLDRFSPAPGWYPRLGSVEEDLTSVRLDEGRIVAHRTVNVRSSIWRYSGKIMQNRSRDTYGYDYEVPWTSPPDPGVLDWYPELMSALHARQTRVHYRSFNAYGRPRRITTKVVGGDQVVEQLVVENRTSDWILGLVTDRTVTATAQDGEVRVRHDAMTYDDAGDLATQTREPDDIDLRLETRLLRGADGLVERVELEDSFGEVRSTDVGYDEDRIYATSWTNALGHTTTRQVHTGLGVTVATVDANGLVSNEWFDGFGRPRHRSASDGTWSAIDYYPGGVGNGGQVETRGSDGSWSWRELNRLGQSVRTRVRGFAGEEVEVRREYDAHGRLVSIQRPHEAGETAVDIEFSHDRLGRLIRTDFPDGTFSTLDHELFQTTATDALGHTSLALRDLHGRTTHVTSHDAGAPVATEYVLGAGGLIEGTVGPTGVTQSFEYDALGRRTVLDDPDAGHRTFAYSAFGEVTTETQPDGTVLTHAYDLLGRRVQTTGPDGSWTMTWDTGPSGTWLGALHQATSPDDAAETYHYDVLGRVSVIETSIEGMSFSERYHYDLLGRVGAIEYPTTPAMEDFTVEYAYNEYGYLTRVSREETGQPFWQAVQVDAEGRVIHEQFANGAETYSDYDPLMGRLDRRTTAVVGFLPGGGLWGGGTPTLEIIADDVYQYDPIGNVVEREDLVGERLETFDYDDLNRLTLWTHDHPGAAARSTDYEYDEAGNLLSVGGPGAPEDYTYGAGLAVDGAGPQAVTNISGWGSMAYDAAGRVVADPERSFTWTPFDLPRTVTKGSATAEFRYGPANQRVYKELGPSRTYYVGQRFERRLEGTNSTDVCRVLAPVGVVAQVERSALGESTVYMHTSRGGTVSAGTDESGDAAFHHYFDPFGGRIDENGDAANASFEAMTLGFTGHEHDDNLDLINMRGRVFDPRLKRFATPDPLVSATSSTQGLNRYSYVLNNPLRYTDPTGFQDYEPDELDYVEDFDPEDVTEYDFDVHDVYGERNHVEIIWVWDDEPDELAIGVETADDVPDGPEADEFVPGRTESHGVTLALNLIFWQYEVGAGLNEFASHGVRDFSGYTSEERGVGLGLPDVSIGYERSVSAGIRPVDDSDETSVSLGPFSASWTVLVPTTEEEARNWSASAGFEVSLVGLSKALEGVTTTGLRQTLKTLRDSSPRIRDWVDSAGLGRTSSRTRNYVDVDDLRARIDAAMAEEAARHVQEMVRQADEAYEQSAAQAEEWLDYSPAEAPGTVYLFGSPSPVYENNWQRIYFEEVYTP